MNIKPQTQPFSPDFQEMQSKFNTFQPTKKDGVFSRIIKKIKRIKNPNYETLKGSIAKEILSFKRLDRQTELSLSERKTKSVPGKAIINAIKVLEDQEIIKNTCVELSKKKNAYDTIKQEISNISNIPFLHYIADTVKITDVYEGATQAIEDRIKSLTSNPIEKEDIGKTDPLISSNLNDDSKNLHAERLMSDPIKKDDIGEIAPLMFSNLKNDSKDLHDNSMLFENKELLYGQKFPDVRSPINTGVRIAAFNNKPVHANRVGDRYIATQAPKDETGAKVFYQMALENSSNTIVNLTNARDKGIVSTYYPPSGQSKSYEIDGNTLEVTAKNTQEFTGFKVVTLELKTKNTSDPIYENISSQSKDNTEPTPDPKEIKIFHFTDWPDHGVPENNERTSFNNFTQALQEHDKKGKTIVHCRAGVGRTGTLIIIEQLRQKIATGEVHQGNFLQKTKELILQGRKERGALFVQAEKQLQFIFEQLIDEVPPPKPPRK